MKKTKIAVYIILAIIALVIAVQFVVADKYQAIVRVIEGEDTIGLNPTTERLDFGDLSRNTGATRYVSIANNGSQDIFVIVWKFGSIAELIKLNKNNFTIASGENARLAFELYLPISADKEEYDGSIWVFKLPKL